jgi:hypothetical protein
VVVETQDIVQKSLCMPNVGDRVLAQWPVEKVWWYPGTIIGMSSGQVVVQFDDGDRSPVGLNEVRDLAVRVGTRVYSRWQAGKTYYPGKVSEAVGQAIHINYDDGDQEWTAICMVRIHQDDN